MNKPHTKSETLITFPCDFPMKVIGNNLSELTQAVINIILKHDQTFDAKKLQTKCSAKDKYIAFSFHVHAINQAQLDAIYQELTKLPDIKMVL